MKIDIPYDILYVLYIQDNLSITDISLKLGLSRDVVYARLKDYNIHKDHDAIYKSRQKNSEITNLRKYGVKNVSQADEIKEKKIATCRKHFGVDYPAQSENWKLKVNKYYQEKFGCDWSFQRTDYWTLLNKDSWLRSQWNSKLKNNSFNKSQVEEEYYKYLLSTFETDDIIRQYLDLDRYPFNCDFYIISKDLFIEINYFWHHGPHPFDSSSKKDLELLEDWKNKATDNNQYHEAIKTWVSRDITKISTAKKNRLNYLLIYPEGVFMYEGDKESSASS